ncbi:hypothetical protein M1563_05280 [Patescibacteria group bacterium]|nr:hypothetical protein [Patescibacteria group bacterium]MCL5409304.1 hypothetical protein [Patescibacteria group bacterium]
MAVKRDGQWLLSRLDFLWSNYFADVEQINPVFIEFGRFARLRFGSIRFDPRSKHTYITISGMFKDEKIPQEIVDHTIAHELCHYVHGFSSPRPRSHHFPHEGGIIKKELSKRGLGGLYQSYQKWIKEYRQELKQLYLQKRYSR